MRWRHQVSGRQRIQKVAGCRPRENNDGVLRPCHLFWGRSGYPSHQCSRADSRLLRGIATGRSKYRRSIWKLPVSKRPLPPSAHVEYSVQCLSVACDSSSAKFSVIAALQIRFFRTTPQGKVSSDPSIGIVRSARKHAAVRILLHVKVAVGGAFAECAALECVRRVGSNAGDVLAGCTKRSGKKLG